MPRLRPEYLAHRDIKLMMFLPGTDSVDKCRNAEPVIVEALWAGTGMEGGREGGISLRGQGQRQKGTGT